MGVFLMTDSTLRSDCEMLCSETELSPPAGSALREAAESATFTISGAACGRLEPGPHGGADEHTGRESVPEQLDHKVRKIITHRHFLELSSRRNGRRSS